MEKVQVNVNHPLWSVRWHNRAVNRRTAPDLATSTRELSGALTLAEDAGRIPRVNLELKFREKRGFEPTTHGMEARLNVRKALRFGVLHQADTSLGASVSYRRDANRTLDARVSAGLGFSLTFRHAISAI